MSEWGDRLMEDCAKAYDEGFADAVHELQAERDALQAQNAQLREVIKRYERGMQFGGTALEGK